jgi:hypothetical protein
MTTPSALVIKMEDLSSSDSIRLFNEYQKDNPGTIWDQVSIDRFDGLKLYSNDRGVQLHFERPLCGYSGNGPSLSIELMELAGFEVTDLMKVTIRNAYSCEFTK